MFSRELLRASDAQKLAAKHCGIMMSDLRTFDQIGPDDVDAVGGKGLSLGLMTRAGLPVPPGFCITTAAYRRTRGRPLADHPDLIGPLLDAYRALGGGPVAVRSSATAEDGSQASFAGQQETILGVRDEDAVRDAVARCWASLDTERAVAYRRKQGIGADGLAMAVVVQRLVEAEVAGVLFTQDPLDREGRQMLVEASWGLGEAVVSGRVTPDRYHLDRGTGAVGDRHISMKRVTITGAGEQPVPAEKQTAACLDDQRLAELAELGRRVEAFYGAPRDVEWAFADGRFWLLQARPITVPGAAEREQVRRREIEALRARAEPGGTVWAKFNLAEVLPEPTPMTWAVVRRFMSGRGGFGLMYRDLGFDPDPCLDDDGFFDLVCGRPYCNLSREAKTHYRTIPFEYPFGELKAAPHKALYPTPRINHARLGWRFWLFFPFTMPRLVMRQTRAVMRQRDLARTFPQEFRASILPKFNGEASAALQQDLTGLAPEALIDLFTYWTRRTLDDFARDSLKPTALAAILMAGLEGKLVRALGPRGAKAAVRDLIMGVCPEPDSDVPSAVRDLADGKLTREAFLDKFGHRCSHEMELSAPRWSEDPAAVDRLCASDPSPGAAVPGLELTWARLVTVAKLTLAQSVALRAELDSLRTHLALRETAKHYLIKGLAVVRRALAELDRRYRLNGGIFFLTPDELPRLVAGEDPFPPQREGWLGVIVERRWRRSLVLSLEVPQVLFSDDLEAIGRPAVLTGSEQLKGTPLSAGVAEAPALVLTEPTGAIPAEPYILVCPSTDPAWVPLFIGSKGLVMETGGVLSHGAIVAREFGLPAVAGLADVHRKLKTGQRLRVDGSRGTVVVMGTSAV
jgi:pyruvate,water dikinase